MDLSNTLKCESWVELSSRIMRTRFQYHLQFLWLIGHTWKIRPYIHTYINTYIHTYIHTYKQKSKNLICCVEKILKKNENTDLILQQSIDFFIGNLSTKFQIFFYLSEQLGLKMTQNLSKTPEIHHFSVFSCNPRTFNCYQIFIRSSLDKFLEVW